MTASERSGGDGSGKLSGSSPIVRIRDLIAADMDGDVVMMNYERGEYFGIGGVGARVWELLAEPVTMAQIVGTVCSEFDVDEERCALDMRVFVEELIKNGLARPA